MSTHDHELNLIPACAHLRHKMMYCDARQERPGHVDVSSDTTVYFCSQTHESLGPDDDPVSPKECCTNRPCYKRT